MGMRAARLPLRWVLQAARCSGCRALTPPRRCLAALCSPDTPAESNMCNGELCTPRCESEASLQAILASNRCAAPFSARGRAWMRLGGRRERSRSAMCPTTCRCGRRPLLPPAPWLAGPSPPHRSPPHHVAGHGRGPWLRAPPAFSPTWWMPRSQSGCGGCCREGLFPRPA